MAKKKSSSSRRFDAIVRVDEGLVEQAKKVAALRGVSLAEYFSDTLRPIIARDFAKEIRKLTEGGAAK